MPMRDVAARLGGKRRLLAALANAPRRDRGFTRAIYSYPAKFQAHLPAALIRLFSAPGDLVVDPWAGGGTTGLEAYLQGRPFVGVDLSPFACLVARVKTSRVDPGETRAACDHALASPDTRAILDDDDAACLGARIAAEACHLAGGIDSAPAGPPARDLLRLALIHTLKIAGRRDFEGESVRPRFRRRVEEILAAVATLPPDGPAPRFACHSNRGIPEVGDGAARLVVTSPPYKDLDVEYGLLQLQRPRLHRSRRSAAIWRLLGVEPLGKHALCGGRGASYWEALAPAVAETARLLAPGAAAFFWTGFKTDADRRELCARLEAAGLAVAAMIPARLSNDRVASSRSTHHGRATGMLPRDYLIGTVRTP